MTGPLKDWERACLRILIWSGIIQGAIVGGTIIVTIIKVLA